MALAGKLVFAVDADSTRLPGQMKAAEATVSKFAAAMGEKGKVALTFDQKDVEKTARGAVAKLQNALAKQAVQVEVVAKLKASGVNVSALSTKQLRTAGLTGLADQKQADEKVEGSAGLLGMGLKAAAVGLALHVIGDVAKAVRDGGKGMELAKGFYFAGRQGMNDDTMQAIGGRLADNNRDAGILGAVESVPLIGSVVKAVDALGGFSASLDRSSAAATQSAQSHAAASTAIAGYRVSIAALTGQKAQAVRGASNAELNKLHLAYQQAADAQSVLEADDVAGLFWGEGGQKPETIAARKATKEAQDAYKLARQQTGRQQAIADATEQAELQSYSVDLASIRMRSQAAIADMGGNSSKGFVLRAQASELGRRNQYAVLMAGLDPSDPRRALLQKNFDADTERAMAEGRLGARQFAANRPMPFEVSSPNAMGQGALGAAEAASQRGAETEFLDGMKELTSSIKELSAKFPGRMSATDGGF